MQRHSWGRQKVGQTGRRSMQPSRRAGAACIPCDTAPEKIMMKKITATTMGCAESCFLRPCSERRRQQPGGGRVAGGGGST